MSFKFNVGDHVMVEHELGTWRGVVQERADTGEGIEYLVSNGPLIHTHTPLLAWEEELSLIKKGNKE